MGVARIVRAAVLLVGAGVAVAAAVRRREGDLGRSTLIPGRSAEPTTEELVAVESPPVEEAPPVEEPPVEEPPVEEPPVEELPIDDPPVEMPDEQPAADERAEAQHPSASVTDVVDDLLAPHRDRDGRIEDATVVEDPSSSDPERRTRT